MASSVVDSESSLSDISFAMGHLCANKCHAKVCLNDLKQGIDSGFYSKI